MVRTPEPTVAPSCPGLGRGQAVSRGVWRSFPAEWLSHGLFGLMVR